MRAFLDYLANNFGPFFEGGAELFLWFFNRSVSALWLIAAVILLRLCLKKAPKWINCALWGICALRLVLPFSLESVLSLIPSAETVPPEVIYHSRPHIESGIPAVDNTVNSQITEYYYEGVTVANGAGISAASFAAFVWIIGILALLIYATISFVRLNKRVRGACELEKGVYESAAVTTPFILGVFRPRIYLPLDMDAKTADYVLRHERAHLHRADHIFKPLGFIILALYWFNPLVWIAYVLYCRDIELACDEKVISGLDAEKRADYAEALLGCAAGSRRFSACPLAFGEVSVKDRVKKALNYKKPVLWIIIAAVICAIVLSACFLTDPVKKRVGGFIVTASGSDYYEGVSISLSSLDMDSDKPTLTVIWQNNTENEFAFDEDFSIHRKQNGTWINCANGDVVFHSIANILMPNSSDKHTYSLKGFDLSKPGDYRFATGTFWIEFTLTEADKSSSLPNLSFKSEIYNIGYGGEEGQAAFAYLSENKEKLSEQNHIPVVRIDSRQEFSTLLSTISAHFSSQQELEALFDECTADFFKEKSLLIMYVWEGSGSVRHKVTGVQKDKNGVLTVTVLRESPEVGTMDMAGWVVAVTADKETLDGCDGFDAIATDIAYLQAVSSSETVQSSSESTVSESSSDIVSENSSLASKDETSSSNSSNETSSEKANEEDEYEKLYVSVTEVDINSENPTITVSWWNNTGKEVTISKGYSIARKVGGRWVDCATDTVVFDKGNFTLGTEYTEDENSKNSKTKRITYSLKGFDLSKAGTYCFVPPIGKPNNVTFNLVDTPEFSNIPFETGVYHTYSRWEEGVQLLDQLSEKRTSSSPSRVPIIRIESRDELLEFAEKIEANYFELDRNNRGECINDMLEKYDDVFFEKQALFLIYIRAGSSSIGYEIKGVERKENNMLGITIFRRRPQMGTADIEECFHAVSMDKKIAQTFNTFDISFYEVDYDDILI